MQKQFFKDTKFYYLNQESTDRKKAKRLGTEQYPERDIEIYHLLYDRGGIANNSINDEDNWGETTYACLMPYTKINP